MEKDGTIQVWIENMRENSEKGGKRGCKMSSFIWANYLSVS